MIGALDLGGFSTQLIFYNHTGSPEKIKYEHFWSHSWINFGVEKIREKVFDFLILSTVLSNKNDDNNEISNTVQNNSDNVTSTSTIESSTATMESSLLSTAITTSEEESVEQPKQQEKVVVLNPCAFKGYEHIIINNNINNNNNNKTFILQGTGDGPECIKILKKVIWPDTNCEVGKACPIDGIVTPPLKNHFFYAMSVYFFALDCVKELGPERLDSWW
jgi:hypothetical protein